MSGKKVEGGRRKAELGVRVERRPRTVNSAQRPQTSEPQAGAPTAHRLPPSAFRLPPFAGMTLLEILAAIGVMSIGLLGLAALLPIGRYTIAEATKADRAGQCGRAAMRDIVVRRMLDYHNWYDPVQNKYVYDPAYNGSRPWFDRDGNPTMYLPTSFLIDPLGATYNVAAAGANPNSNFGGLNSSGANATSIPRISLATPVQLPPGPAFPPPFNKYVPIPYSSQNGTPWTPTIADSIFRASDDLIVTLPENLSPPQAIGRPLNINSFGQPQPLDYTGAYSWFLTVTPMSNSPTVQPPAPAPRPAPNSAVRFTVSVVVCFQRSLASQGSPIGERAVPVTQFYDTATVGGVQVALGGGSLYLQSREINDTGSDNPALGIQLKENDWVALCSPQRTNPGSGNIVSGICSWYRVASIGDNTQYLTLIGPDWSPTPNQDQLVALGQEVVGVYTTVVELDTDPTWTN